MYKILVTQVFLWDVLIKTLPSLRNSWRTAVLQRKWSVRNLRRLRRTSQVVKGYSQDSRSASAGAKVGSLWRKIRMTSGQVSVSPKFSIELVLSFWSSGPNHVCWTSSSRSIAFRSWTCTSANSGVISSDCNAAMKSSKRNGESLTYNQLQKHLKLILVRKSTTNRVTTSLLNFRRTS